LIESIAKLKLLHHWNKKELPEERQLWIKSNGSCEV
jgi:hypothetical protein